MSRKHSKLIVLGGLLLGCAPAGPEEMTYVQRLGIDTLAVEQFTRTADRIEGRMVVRRPTTRVGHYVATLSPEQTITRFEMDWTTPAENPEGPPPRRYAVTMEGDSAVIETATPEGTDTSRIAVPERTIPSSGLLPEAVAIWQQVVRQAMASGEDEWSFNLLQASRARTSPNALTRHSADSVSMNFFGMPLLARVDRDGGVLGISGRETTLKVEIERGGQVDLDRLAADFAARDARGEGFGVASPGDTVEATGGGARFEVVYSQPAKRGREIWGGLVPYDEVWRTGANAATQFTTDRDLVIGGARVPAGSYTVWTTFTAETDTLIINKETGIWGTAYDGSNDLVRVPLQRGELEDAVERFTIAIESRDDGGVLRLLWDTRELRVGMQVRR